MITMVIMISVAMVIITKANSTMVIITKATSTLAIIAKATSTMVIIAKATSTMVIITIIVQFKRVFGQGRDGERLLCFVLWSLLCLQVSYFYCYLEKLVNGMSDDFSNQSHFMFVPMNLFTAACMKFGFGRKLNVKCS